MNHLRETNLWIGISSTASAALFIAGFWPARSWPAFVLPLAAAVFWVLVHKWEPFWAASTAFLMILVGCGYGLVIHLSPIMLVASATAALAAWDLALFSQSSHLNPSAGDEVISMDHNAARSESSVADRHRFWLVIGLGLGFLLAAAGLALRVNLPFGVVVILALIVFITLAMAGARIIK